MFSKKNIKIPDNNIAGVIKEETEEFDTSSDHGLSEIKYEFEEEETTNQYGVLGNQLKEENFDEQLFDGEFSENPPKMESPINDMFYQKVMQVEDDEIESESTSSDSSNIKCEFEEEETKIQYGENVDLQFFDGEFSKSPQKIESTINAMLSKKAIKIEDDEIKSKNTEENDAINTWLDSTNVRNSTKCEFEAEETTIQYGVLGNQLKEENFEEPQLFHGEFSENSPKMETTINDMFYQKVMQVEDDEIESESTSSDSSNIKCEFEEEETRIQYGAFENQLHEETVDKATMDIPKVPILDGELTKSFQKRELPISNMFSKEDIELARSQKTDSTTVKGDLNRHNRTHTGKRPYKCETKGETKGDLNRHNRTHTGNRPYKCETCGKYFTHNSALNVHNRTHTEDKPCKCETCGKCFTQMGNLNRHKRMHTGERPYKCETCGKCFSEKADLKRHNRTHSGERPYKCETCGKCFTLKKVLIVHNRTHTEDKPYKCETCGKCFTRNHTLNKHNRIHTCETCSKCFADKRSLNLHNRTHAGE